MQAADMPNPDSDIQSSGTTSIITIERERRFFDGQNMYVFCTIIYKSIILYDLKVMINSKGIFRNGISVIRWCQNKIIFSFEANNIDSLKTWKLELSP